MSLPRPWLIFLTGLAIGMVSGCGRGVTAAAPDPSTPVAWVELTGAGPELRVTSSNGRCPDAEIDGQPRSTTLRSPTTADFPAVCTLAVPADTKRLSLGGKLLPLLHGTPQRIVIIGDTGCRIQGLAAQACNDPAAWPFPAVAARAAAEKPDLVIHVGDYYYREDPCPLGKAVCAGSPHGDHWPTWRAEFFDPAAPLLAQAPVILVRGNHEECRRGGEGWFRLLDASPWRGGCDDLSNAFAAKAGDLTFGVLDSSAAEDRSAPEGAVADMARQFATLQPELAKGESFILTHRPIWAMVPAARLGPLGTLSIAINRTEQAAARDAIPDTTRMVIAGHIHHFAAYSFGAARPAQLVAGEGGDEPLPADRPRFDRTPATIDGLPASRLSFARYGYVVMERDGDAWKIVAHEVDGRIAANCRLTGRTLTCDTDRPR